MEEPYKAHFRSNDLRAKRSPSKVVSEAFGFLDKKSYSGRDGVVRIQSSYSESRLATMDGTENPSWDIALDGLHTDVYIPDEEFTIVTTVDKSPQPKHRASAAYQTNTQVANDDSNRNSGRRESLPNMNADGHLVTTGLNNTLIQPEKESGVTEGGDVTGGKLDEDDGKSKEFTIVTYIEDHNKGKEFKDDAQAANKTVAIMDKLEVPGEEKRKSVNIEGEVVELRSSPVRNSKPARTPTWKHNQGIVSEAFNFLHDLEGGDTMSVIAVGVDDDDLCNVNGLAKTGNINDSMSDSKLENGRISRENLYKDNNDMKKSENTINKTSAHDSMNTPKSNPKVNTFGKTILPPSPSLPDNRISSVSNCSTDRSSTVSEKNDKLGELRPSKLRQRRRSPRKDTEDDDDADSSDEDRGVYRESFRKSTWLYVGDSSDVSSKGGNSIPTESGYISLADLDIKGCDDDSIFGDDVEPPPTPSPLIKVSHERNASTSTTVSEREFRNAYSHVSKRMVKRADSEQEYKRYSAKVYDHEKVFTIEKDENSGYGIHIIDSHPAVITGVDDGSPGAKAGVREGQIVISINNVNVLEHEHDDIVKLVQENSRKLVLEVGCSDVAHVRDLELPIMTGFLMKQTSAILFKTWKKRYFILRRDNCLYYYKTEKDNDPLGAIPLTGYTVSRHGDHNKFSFKAEKFGNRTNFFMAETREDMAKWVGALNEAALRSRHKKDTWLDVTTNNVGLPALEIRKPDCSGYLYKMGRVTKRWRKHYCVLKDACIYHYKNSSSKEAIGVAHLHGYKVDPAGVASKKLSFNLVPPDPQMRMFSFYTDNETDKSRWVEALQTSIQKWVKVG